MSLHHCMYDIWCGLSGLSVCGHTKTSTERYNVSHAVTRFDHVPEGNICFLGPNIHILPWQQDRNYLKST